MKSTPLYLAIIAVLLLIAVNSCVKEDNGKKNGEVEEELSDAEIFAKVRNDVQNTAFYKEIFLDGGCELNPGIKQNGVVINGKLPYALAKVGIKSGDAEYFLSTVDDVGDGYTETDKALQTNIFSGTSQDTNGVLLYPDGEPRFHLFYSFGGHSGPHGKTLGAPGRTNVNTFYTNGGSYVGSCAGAYLAGKYASGSVSNYYNIWKDGNMKGTGVGNSSIDIGICSDVFSKYFGPANGILVKGARHNGGGYMDVSRAPEGTEVLGIFQHEKNVNSSKEGFFNQPGVWAYKASRESGRLVVTGSHPEDAASGDILNMTASMFAYAQDGSGIAKIKGVLRNGDMIPMTRKTEENLPQYTRIGDLQCHHFVIWLGKAVESLTLSVESPADCDLELYLKKDNFAFPENDPDYESTAKSNNQTIKTDKLEKGLWYVTVRCATTVNATEKYIDATKKLGRFFVYSGNTDVLNGIPYNIVASW